MIMTVAELRQFVTTTETDQELTARLSAIESLIRNKTNNNFQARPFRAVGVAVSDGKQILIDTAIPYKVGDTLQITESEYQPNALVTIASISDGTIVVLEDLYDEGGIVVTKVTYPPHIKIAAVEMVKWDLSMRNKVGIASESISRHSQSFVDQNNEGFKDGYPRSIMALIKPSYKMQVGQGVKL